MKKIILYLFIAGSFIILLRSNIFAQTATDDESTSFNTLINRIDDFSGFGSFMMNFGSNNKNGYVLTGGGGAALFNKMYYVGGFGMSGKLNAISETDVPLTVDLNYGGFWLGYIYKKDMLIHPTASLKLGWGNAVVESSNLTDNIFAFVPQIGAEINVMKWVKLELGIAYQLVSGINLINIDARQFRKLHIGLDFKFGWFK